MTYPYPESRSASEHGADVDASITADIAEATEWADAGLEEDVKAIEQMGFAAMAQAYALIAIAKGIARHNEIQEELLT